MESEVEVATELPAVAAPAATAPAAKEAAAADQKPATRQAGQAAKAKGRGKGAKPGPRKLGTADLD